MYLYLSLINFIKGYRNFIKFLKQEKLSILIVARRIQVIWRRQLWAKRNER